MKKIIILIAFISVFLASFKIFFNPQPKKMTEKFFPDLSVEMNTPALQKKGFTKHQDLIEFLNSLAQKYPNIMNVSYIGESQKGKKIPLVILNKENKPKELKVWLQGGLHGDEPASTEGILFLIEQLLTDKKYSHLLEKLEIGILPMANIDGYEKQDRYAANGLDLNRDQTKLVAHESVILKRAYTEFNPQVALDFHEYRPFRRDFAQMGDFGISSRYDVMLLYSGNLNVPQNLRDLTQNVFVYNAKKELDKSGLSHHDYITSTKVLGDIQFNQGSVNARSSATNYALTNTISTLVEVRGVALGKTSFKRRVYSTFLVAHSYLQTSFLNIDKIKNTINKANSQNDNAVVVKSKRLAKNEKITVIDVSKNEEVEIDVVIRNALNSKAVLSRKRPSAYIINKDYHQVIEKLKILGLEVNELLDTKKLKVEKYLVTDYLKQTYKYEGVKMQKVKTKIITEEISFEKGTFIVYMNQQRANLAIEVLEPEADNSMVSFSIIQTDLGQELPIYRLIINQ